MSDLAGGSAGRASNGGARTGGPVPVSSGASRTTGIRTPQDIMRDRNAREARRQQEAQRDEEQRRAEERRRSAERRAAAVTGGAPRFSTTSSVYSPDLSTAQEGFGSAGDRRSRAAGEVASSNVLGDPTGRAGGGQEPSRRAERSGASQDASRARGPSVSQPSEQPRPVATSAGATRRQPTVQASSSRQPAQSATAGAAPQASASTANTAAGGPAGRNSQSSFPHAFERWETLSSHWEGLTSYWLHKLEQNTEEIRDTVPNASTLNRQITDLSAAGANLFHAVVELQRLRASSERKFQRWFFETRADNERNREIQAGLERQLQIERQAREETSRTQTDNSTAVENARKEVAEMRRELAISKDEARRAWEELGRRNQESLDTAQSLKEGRVTIVSGVQVMPYFGGPVSRTGSASVSQRPVTRDGPQPGYSSAGVPSAAGAFREEGPSPTNTDPFTDSGRQQQSLHHQPETPSLAQGTYQPQFGTPASASTAATAIPATAAYTQGGSSQQPRAGQPSVSSADAQRFYTHGQQATMLHGSSAAPATVPTTAAQTAPIRPRSDVRSEGSYVDTISEGDTEYAIDASGNIRHDEQGRPIVFSRQREQPRSSESEDDFDTEQAVRREQELATRYGSGLIPEAPSVPTTSNQAMATFTPTAGGSQNPDYEGGEYDNYQQFVPRHHHPTRLSDVLEEDEERSSRRTGGD